MTNFKKVTFKGQVFNISEAATPEMILEFFSVVEINEDYWNDRKLGNKPSRVSDHYTYIGGGACGAVYSISEDVCMKVNGRDSLGSSCRDGQVMRDLQGLPFIPTLYAYAEDNEYMMMQKVKGATTSKWRMDRPFPLQELKATEQAIRDFYEGCKDRGWLPSDIHGANVMVDEEGGFWVVDVGLFKTTDRWTSGLEDLLCEVEMINEKIAPQEPAHKPIMVLEAEKTNTTPQAIGQQPQSVKGFVKVNLKTPNWMNDLLRPEPAPECNLARGMAMHEQFMRINMRKNRPYPSGFGFNSNSARIPVFKPVNWGEPAKPVATNLRKAFGLPF